MSRDIPSFPLRIPPHLEERIQQGMAESLRSKNAEVIYQLERGYAADRALVNFSTGELITELLSRFERGDIFIQIGKPPADEARTNKKAR